MQRPREGTHRTSIRAAVTHDQEYLEAILAATKANRLLLQRICVCLEARKDGNDDNDETT